uniref:Uncharacterized protein n=1 Tax=Rhizophora mucronata TaxID=61149 RepID=A0A2P2IJ72_RHIMU
MVLSSSTRILNGGQTKKWRLETGIHIIKTSLNARF